MKQLMTWVRDYLCLNKKFLVYNLVSRNLKIKYRRSFLGIFWTLLLPLLSAMIYFIVFKVVIQIHRPNYLVLLLSGVMSWNYFSQTIMEGVTHLTDQQILISKISLPIQVFSFTTSMTNLVTLLFSIPVILVIEFIQGTAPDWSFLLLPYFVGLLFLMAYATSALLSILYIFFRDMKQVMSLILQLLFYGTPILYTADMIPEKFSWVLHINPIGYLILGTQNCFLHRSEWRLENFLTPLVWAILFSALALLAIKKLRKTVVENL